MSEYQPNPLFAGKTGSASVGKMSKVLWQGGSRPESESLCVEPRVSPAHRTKGPFLGPCNCNHLIASTGLCPFGEPHCLLSPSAPHTKGLRAPSLVPKTPFSHTGELSCPCLSAVAFNVGCFFFFQPELIQHCLLIALGVHPYPT